MNIIEELKVWLKAEEKRSALEAKEDCYYSPDVAEHKAFLSIINKIKELEKKHERD